jgi:hypothetical protein
VMPSTRVTQQGCRLRNLILFFLNFRTKVESTICSQNMSQIYGVGKIG